MTPRPSSLAVWNQLPASPHPDTLPPPPHGVVDFASKVMGIQDHRTKLHEKHDALMLKLAKINQDLAVLEQRRRELTLPLMTLLGWSQRMSTS